MDVKADKSELDGEWIPTAVANLLTTAAVGSYTVDLSNYLPKDDHDYEIFLIVRSLSKAQSGFKWIGIGSSLVGHSIAIQNNGAVEYQNNNFVMPIGTDRRLQVSIIEKNFQDVHIEGSGYRRLGKAK